MADEKILEQNNEPSYSYFGRFKFMIRLFDAKQPFWLPKGTIRAILVLATLFTYLYCMVTAGMVDQSLKELTWGLVGLYMGSRMEFNKNQSDDKNS